MRVRAEDFYSAAEGGEARPIEGATGLTGVIAATSSGAGAMRGVLHPTVLYPNE
ncbi:uncharacterized protein UBRO2_06011 [Ustilago bromivora]|uniref:Uncharacterized protein n=1 Tax=Ustilago bromivora TaxID=307758 RepID=A0A8H8TVL4_9BASI|nr:uncharacterized protein UBRO2_06011 [Ustilago bromivora]